MHPWRWTLHLHPEVILLCLALLAGYRIALRTLGRSSTPAATRRQVTCFCLGVLTIFVAAEYPIHDLAERSLYSVHMFQHILITLVAAPLFLLGTPAWLARALLPGRLMRVARALTRPAIALAIFNATIVFTHWPKIVDASVQSEPLHFLFHLVLFVTALIMWTPVFSPLLELPRLSYPGQMLYLFLQSLVPTVPASFLTFGSHPLYAIYIPFARPWSISALADQRAAGVIMKLVGGAILWVVIAKVFFKWSRMERIDGVDALEYRDVDRTMNRMELTK